MADPVIRRIVPEDLEEIIILQAKVWQDYFLREKGLQVPLMRRTRQNLLYYHKKEPDGCFVASLDDRIVGCIFSHVWGTVGWFGPFEVLPEFQRKGIGTALVEHSVRYLTSKGCETIGLETMASSEKNISLYSKLGFEKYRISHVFQKIWKPAQEVAPKDGLRRFDLDSDIEPFKSLWNDLIPGLDHTSELEPSLALGDIWVTETPRGLAHAIVHTYDMFENGQNAIIKLLVAPEGEIQAASDLLEACERSAMAAGKTGLFVRNYEATPPDFKFFLERGYVLRSTSIRMIKQGQDESGGTLHVSCWSG
jgi:GNAT superfamily N-acetyltransferase